MHPFQRDCPRDDPKKFAAWAWAAGIPDPGVNRPEPIPLISPPLVEGVSKMLWDFGFRHHAELQTQWIEGAAGLGTIAQIVDKEPQDHPMDALAERFLADEDPRLLEAIRKAPPEEKAKLLAELEKNLKGVQAMIEKLKEA